MIIKSFLREKYIFVFKIILFQKFSQPTAWKTTRKNYYKKRIWLATLSHQVAIF